jgi:hypothetical protein
MTLPAIVAGHTTVQDVSATTTRNINTPTHASGNYIVIAAVSSTSQGNATKVAVSGFDAFYNDPEGPATYSIYLFYKKAGGSEPANYTITSASGVVSAIAVAISNFGGFDSLAVTPTTGSSATATAPAVITQGADRLRISIIFADDNPGITTVATLAGHTLLATVTGLLKPTVSFQHKDIALAGTDASQTAALSGSETWAGITFAIAPDTAEDRITKAGVYLELADEAVDVTKAGLYLEILLNQIRLTAAGIYLEITEDIVIPPAPVARPWFSVWVG